MLGEQYPVNVGPAGTLGMYDLQSKRFDCFNYGRMLHLGRVICREKRDVDQAEAHIRLLDAWQAPDSSKRPSVSLLVDFALALLQHADAALLQRLLSVRYPYIQIVCSNTNQDLYAVMGLLRDTCSFVPLSSGYGFCHQLVESPWGAAP